MGIACVWLAVAAEKTYPTFVVARAFLGLWEAPIEAIVPSTVTDLFYLHERGMMISIYGLCVLGGNELGPLLSAYIIQGLSMRWAFFIVAMVIGLSLLIMVFSMPETKFDGARPVIVPGVNPLDPLRHRGTSIAETLEGPERRQLASLKRGSFLRDLSYCSVIDRQVSLWKVFVRPLVLALYPTILWSSLVYGMSLSWNVILGATVAQLFGAEYVSSPQFLPLFLTRA